MLLPLLSSLLLLLLLSLAPPSASDGTSAYSELVSQLQRVTIEANAKIRELSNNIYALEKVAVRRNRKVGEEIWEDCSYCSILGILGD